MGYGSENVKYEALMHLDGQISRMPRDKRATAREAIQEYVKDGSYLCLGWIAPAVALLHEIARQGQKDLTMIWDSHVVGGSLLIGLGQVKKVEMAYQWGAIQGNDMVWRRAFEKQIPRKVEIDDYTNAAIAWRLYAGATGLPFMAVPGMIGSDIPKYNKNVKEFDDPFGSGAKVSLVPAARPDVTILHCHRADIYGNAQWFGFYGNSDVQGKAAKRLIISCEEIVPTDEIRRCPNNTLIPHYYVDAVVHLPFGAHWREVNYMYHQDFPFGMDMFTRWETVDGFRQWCDEYIFDVKDWDGYCRKVGYERLHKLAAMERKFQVIGEVR